jgi:hypothetical protein
MIPATNGIAIKSLDQSLRIADTVSLGLPKNIAYVSQAPTQMRIASNTVASMIAALLMAHLGKTPFLSPERNSHLPPLVAFAPLLEHLVFVLFPASRDTENMTEAFDSPHPSGRQCKDYSVSVSFSLTSNWGSLLAHSF